MSKNRTFYYLCFLEKSGQKILFFDILDKKELLLDQKIEVLKGLKNRHFLKGLVQKSFFFLSHLCFFAQIMSEKIVFLIFWIKKIEISTRNWSSKKSTLSKGDNPWFLFKNQTFLINFFFGENNSVKTFVFFFILDRKKMIFRPEN